MPDGDRIQSKLAPRYHGPYKQVCEARFGPYKLARSVLKPLLADIKRQGNGPIQLIADGARLLASVPTEPIRRRVFDWIRLDQSISRLASGSRYGNNKRAKQLAVDAIRQKAYNIRIGSSGLNYHLDVCANYLRNTYQANFEERIPLLHLHGGADPADVQKTLDSMRPDVEQALQKCAAQLVKTGSVVNLRRPNQRKTPVTLDEELPVM